MVKILIAMDESPPGIAAFNTGIGLVKRPDDELFLMRVVTGANQHSISSLWTSTKHRSKVDRHEEQMVHQWLQQYAEIAEERNIQVHLVMGIADHIGELICQVAESKKIDFLVLGRRGMNTFKRKILGSTSQYCVENACCTVVVVQ